MTTSSALQEMAVGGASESAECELILGEVGLSTVRCEYLLRAGVLCGPLWIER